LIRPRNVLTRGTQAFIKYNQFNQTKDEAVRRKIDGKRSKQECRIRDAAREAGAGGQARGSIAEGEILTRFERLDLTPDEIEIIYRTLEKESIEIREDIFPATDDVFEKMMSEVNVDDSVKILS
jgi:hypothetical protein